MRRRLMKTYTNGWLGLLSVLALLSAAPVASAYYDPGVQRWINRDPLGELGFGVLRSRETPIPRSERNRYRFVGNSPVAYFDPLGLGWTTFFACSKWQLKKCESLGFEGCTAWEHSYTDGYAFIIETGFTCFHPTPPPPPSPEDPGGGGGDGGGPRPVRPVAPPCTSVNRPPTVRFPPGPPVGPPPRYPILEPIPINR